MVSPNNPALYTDDRGVLYSKMRDTVALMRAPTNLADTYCVPEGVTHIVENAFESCHQLKKLIVPESVWSIMQGAFVDCPDLTICGKAGSEADETAHEHGLPFVAI